MHQLRRFVGYQSMQRKKTITKLTKCVNRREIVCICFH